MKTFFLAAAAALIAAAPAAAQDPAPAPTPESFYFDCGGDTPFTNVTEAPQTWSAAKPDAASTDGAGCYSMVYEMAETTFGGTYAGEVKQLDLTLFGALSNPVYRQLLGVSLNVVITVDGKTVFAGEQLAGGNEAAGALPGGFKWTLTVPELDIPATDTPKTFVISVSNPFVDDQYFLGRGASDLASGITFYDAADLPEPEPEEEL
jgi:hypothetical protein